MAKKKYFMILDTETCGDLVFDYGYTVIDRKGNMVAEGSFVCEEFMNHPEILDMFNDLFTKDKIAEYYFSLYMGLNEFTVMPFAEIRRTINTVRKAFNATVCAYNASFDVSHLLKTAQYFGYNQFFKGNVEFMDIWAMALSVLCNSRNYLKFCAKHNLTTAKGHPQTGAEAVYRYLTKDATFEEKHTARQDCEIESYIFTQILRRKKKYDSEFVKMCIHNPYWKEISKRFAEF
jgi:hypothetical protein